MNGKQARNLRKIVKDNLTTLPVVDYKETNTHEKLFFGGHNTDGTVRYIPVEVSTRVLDGCQRQHYQRMKHYHNAYYGR